MTQYTVLQNNVHAYFNGMHADVFTTLSHTIFSFRTLPYSIQTFSILFHFKKKKEGIMATH